MIEKWIDCINYPRYEVSSLGNVRHKKFLRILKFQTRYDGYLNVCIRNSKNKQQSPKIHKLVADSFLGIKGKDYQVDHINRIRSDNRLENLRIIKRNMNQLNRISVIGMVAHIIDLHKNGMSILDIEKSLEK